MIEDWLILVQLSGCFLALFALAEVLFHVLKVPAELTRKLVHFVTGIITLAFPFLLQHLWQVVAICFSFLLLLLISKRYNLLKSINAIDRPSLGSALYPLVVIMAFAFYQYRQSRDGWFAYPFYFSLPILLLAICDPLAALAGRSVKSHNAEKGKTRVGSAAFFVSALSVSFALCFYYTTAVNVSLLLGYALGISAITTMAEKYTGGGRDNLTIPASAIIFMETIERIT